MFFPSADFEGENSATQSVVLSENGGKGFVKLGCDKQLRRSKASETKCGNRRIMGCQQFLMQSFKMWINIRWWKQSFCHRKIFLFFLAALSPKIHPARLVFDRCWAEVFLSLRVSIRVHEVILESGGGFLSFSASTCVYLMCVVKPIQSPPPTWYK